MATPLPTPIVALSYLLVYHVVILSISATVTVYNGTLPPLHVHKHSRTKSAIMDARGQTVLLRGVNLNALGDYYQANPHEPTICSASEKDFKQMASLGFNVVRLIVSWSKLEPQKGVINDAYIEEIKMFVQYAKQHGIYTVLDMHQDAWGKYIATPRNESKDHCGEFLEPAIGWDGAPQWATLTEGASTCRVPHVRELSRAVAASFQNFWYNKHGIQDHLIELWARLAKEFAAEPAVAGFDLINEPNFGTTVGLTETILLGNYYSKALKAIRKAEESVNGGFHHIALFQCTAEWSAFTFTLWPIGSFMFDSNIMFAPHLYGGSITTYGTISEGYKSAQRIADFYERPFWSGEWGWFNAPNQETEEQVWKYAQHEDNYLIGGATWQWKQACGDPHSQKDWGGRNVTETQYHVNIIHCPNSEDGGINPNYQHIITRGYPRSTPGELYSLFSDPFHGYLEMSGSAEKQGRIELWIPQSNRRNVPAVKRGAPWHVAIEETQGGFYVYIDVGGDYHIEIDY